VTAWAAYSQCLRHSNTIHPGHRKIQHDDIRLQLGGQLEARLTINGFADHLHCRIILHQRLKTREHETVVVSDEDADWHPQFSLSGLCRNSAEKRRAAARCRLNRQRTTDKSQALVHADQPISARLRIGCTRAPLNKSHPVILHDQAHLTDIGLENHAYFCGFGMLLASLLRDSMPLWQFRGPSGLPGVQ
jgi:hypothetical protein